MSYMDDDDDEPWARRTSNPRSSAGASTSLRAQLSSIADTWERTKLSEQSALNRRINSLVAQNKTSTEELETMKEKLSDAEDKIILKDKEIKELNEKMLTMQSGQGVSSKKMLGLQFLLAELVENWPKIPIYKQPPLIESESESESDSDSDSDNEINEDSLLEAGRDGDDIDDDDILNQQEKNQSPNGGRNKNKKRGKRGGKKKKKTIENGRPDSPKDNSDSESSNSSSPSSSPSLSPTKNKKDISSLSLSHDDDEDEDGINNLIDKLVGLDPSLDDELVKKKKQKNNQEEDENETSLEIMKKNQKSKKKKKKKVKRLPAPMPVISHYEKAPFPSEFSAPNGLVTRNAFYDLVGCEGLTRKQLMKLEGIFDNAENEDYDLTALVDESLGGGLNACCGASGSLRIVKLLLAQGANPSYMGQQFDSSPVHRAVQFGHDNLVSLLLTHKVNINATDQNLGRTALHYAAQYNRPTLAKLLIQKGAMVDAVDNNGETATAIAERLKWKKVATILSDPSVLFWNFANRANKLYKATEFELSIKVYEKAFDILPNVRPVPSEQNRATLHYNCARAASNLGQQVKALQQCNSALLLMPKYNSALEQRAKYNDPPINSLYLSIYLFIYLFIYGTGDISTKKLSIYFPKCYKSFITQ